MNYILKEFHDFIYVAFLFKAKFFHTDCIKRLLHMLFMSLINAAIAKNNAKFIKSSSKYFHFYHI